MAFHSYLRCLERIMWRELAIDFPLSSIDAEAVYFGSRFDLRLLRQQLEEDLNIEDTGIIKEWMLN